MIFPINMLITSIHLKAYIGLERLLRIFFYFDWSSIINKDLLLFQPKGVIGYHSVKLPENRGRNPIIWAITLGLQNSASTFFMQESADDGDTLSQIDIEISNNDDTKTVYEKVTEIALEQIKIFVPQLENNICI